MPCFAHSGGKYVEYASVSAPVSVSASAPVEANSGVDGNGNNCDVTTGITNEVRDDVDGCSELVEMCVTGFAVWIVVAGSFTPAVTFFVGFAI